MTTFKEFQIEGKKTPLKTEKLKNTSVKTTLRPHVDYAQVYVMLSDGTPRNNQGPTRHLDPGAVSKVGGALA